MKTRLHLNNRRANQRGLTLIELVVVLAILVALAGLIVANFPGVITRAHTATCSTSIADVNKVMQYSFTTKLKYPTGYDSLLNDTDKKPFAKLPGHLAGTPLGSTNVLTSDTLTDGEASALAALGVTNSYNLDPTKVDATWTVVDLTSQNSFLAGGTRNAAILSTDTATNVWPNLALTVLNTNVTTRFVMFGIGLGCSGVGPGQLMQEPPTHFGDNVNMNPKDNYQRLAVVFRVDTDANGSSASFVGAAGLHDDGLGTTEADLAEYYNAQ